MGRVCRVTATLDYLKAGDANYDRLCLANLETQQGLMGRVVQDVVTQPPRKWARLQGSEGYIEWHCGYGPGQDAVIYAIGTQEPMVETITKTRPDDFIAELSYVGAAMDGDGTLPYLSIERGLDTMMVIAAAHRSSEAGRTVALDWSQGYRLAGLRTED